VAHDGLARAINPVHTMSDGDTLFALGTGQSGRTLGLMTLFTLAAEAVAVATARAICWPARWRCPVRPGCRAGATGCALPASPATLYLTAGRVPGTRWGHASIMHPPPPRTDRVAGGRRWGWEVCLSPPWRPRP
jgi:hypothetical protein